MSLETKNQVYKYLNPALFVHEKLLSKTLSNKQNFVLLGYYLGDMQIDNDNVVYIKAQLLNKLAINELEIIPSIKKVYDIGGLFSTQIMIIVELRDGFENARNQLLLSNYSKMYTNRQLREFQNSGLAGKNFIEVTTKSDKKRRELEIKYNCRIVEETELDEIIHLEREVYNYEPIKHTTLILE